MSGFFDASAQLLGAQLVNGLISGSFYALLSLGISVIFGLLRIANFVHGAQFTMGAFAAWFLLDLPNLFPDFGLPAVNYWVALILAPIIVAGVGMVTEMAFLRRVYELDHAYGLLLTIGLAMVIEGMLSLNFGNAGKPYSIPAALDGGFDLGFMYLPAYRVWVISASTTVCLATWFLIDRTRLGAYLRAATENPGLVEAFGIKVPRMLTLTYGFGVGLAAFAGVMAAPINQVSTLMGANIIIVIFAIVVIGGMGSILGSIVTGFALGIVEALTKIFYPEASTTVIFIVMAFVLLLRPAGLFGKAQ